MRMQISCWSFQSAVVARDSIRGGYIKLAIKTQLVRNVGAVQTKKVFWAVTRLYELQVGQSAIELVSSLDGRRRA